MSYIIYEQHLIGSGNLVYHVGSAERTTTAPLPTIRSKCLVRSNVWYVTICNHVNCQDNFPRGRKKYTVCFTDLGKLNLTMVVQF